MISLSSYPDWLKNTPFPLIGYSLRRFISMGDQMVASEIRK